MSLNMNIEHQTLRFLVLLTFCRKSIAVFFFFWKYQLLHFDWSLKFINVFHCSLLLRFWLIYSYILLASKIGCACFWKYHFRHFHLKLNFLDALWREAYPCDHKMSSICSVIYDFNPCVLICFCCKYVFLNEPLMLSLV